MAEGLAEGLEKGKAKGLEEGKAEGLAEGKAVGLAEGEHKKAVEMALKLLTKGTALDEIADITGLTIKEIEEL